MLKRGIVILAILLTTVVFILSGCATPDTRSAEQREADRLESLNADYATQHPDDIIVYAGRRIRDNQPILGWKDDNSNGATYSSESYEIGKLPAPLSIGREDLIVAQIDSYHKEPWYEVIGEGRKAILASAGVSDSERVVINGVNLQIPLPIKRELVAEHSNK